MKAVCIALTVAIITINVGFFERLAKRFKRSLLALKQLRAAVKMKKAKNGLMRESSKTDILMVKVKLLGKVVLLKSVLTRMMLSFR